MSELNTRSLEIVDHLKSKYINHDGLVSATFPPSRHNLLDHFGDYAPFMLHFGETQFVRTQIEYSRAYTYHGVLRTNNRLVSYQNNEYIEVLAQYLQLRHDADIDRMIEAFTRGIAELLVRRGFVLSYYEINTKSQPLIASPMSGALVEVFLCSQSLFHTMAQLSLEIIDRWIEIPFFKRFGLFPTKYYIDAPYLNDIYLKSNIPISDRIKNLFGVNFFTLGSWSNVLYRLPWGVSVQVAKDNTNFLFALIEAYRTTKDTKYRRAIMKWVDGVKHELLKDCFVYRFWHPQHGARDIDLVCNVALIDVLCDIYYFVERDSSLLGVATDIAKSWINKSLWGINLLPKRYGGDVDHLDNNTDFCISLMRLYELTGQDEYCEIANRVLKGILEHHYTKDGYVTSVNKDGVSVDGRVEPKYNALLLKALIMFDGKKKIYGDDYIHGLMKDR